MRFPKMSIAESVVNRIFNAREEARSLRPPSVTPSIPQPVLPDPVPQGEALDQQIATPVAGPVQDDANVVQAVASGKSPLDGLIDPQ